MAKQSEQSRGLECLQPAITARQEASPAGKRVDDGARSSVMVFSSTRHKSQEEGAVLWKGKIPGTYLHIV